MLPSLEAVRAEKALRSLRDYIKQAWPIIEPATEYLDNWHIGAIAEYLEAVTVGQIRFLVINMPPRLMKSTSVTIMWPTWVWLREPSTEWLFTSYASSLAIDHSLKRRIIIESHWYQSRWGHLYKMASDQNQKSQFNNDKAGSMAAMGLAGPAQGKNANYLVVDDPHDAKDAQSDLSRESDLQNFKLKFATRLNNKKKDKIVVVMQRLHEQDLSGFCKDLGYEMLVLPSIAEGRTVITLPISKREIVRESGELLWPEREGKEELDQALLTLGSYGFAGQHQQRPSPLGGGILKRYWWRFWYYKDSPLPPVRTLLADGTIHEHGMMPLPERFDEVLQSWDMTFKDTKTSDYVAGQVWARLLANRFLLDQVLDRMDMPATVQALLNLSAEWPQATAKLVEDKANGPAVLATLRGKVSGLIAVEPKGGKIARVNAIAPVIEAGNVYLPHPQIAPWVSEFIEWCAQFPFGKFDDPIDTMSQALARWLGRQEVRGYTV